MHPALTSYVTSLVAYDADLGGPGVHIGMPSTSVTWVLPVGQPLDVSWAGEPGSRVSQWSTVSGLHTAPAAIHHDGTQHGVQLALTPAGCRTLLGVPASGVAAQLVDLADLDVPELAHLPERLAAAPNDSDRLALVEGVLLQVLARRSTSGGPRAEVGRALRLLTRGEPVAAVADEVGYSRRHLTTLVRGECGLTPKDYQRVARFDLSRRLLARAARAGRPSLAGVGARAGYADQAHLTHEWGRLAGCTPTTWLREEFPFLQDPTAAATAS